MPMAGRFRDLVTFQRLLAGDDTYGNAVTSWDEDWLTVGADMLEGLGREAVAAGRLESGRTATLRVRRSTETLAITADDRVLARGKLWNVRSVVAVGRKNELLEMLCEEGGAV
jgi:SPP1 family predicted phage head-tail adaptor